MMKKFKLKKGDQVMVISGKDKGKKGKADPGEDARIRGRIINSFEK